jgi:hypothetical protein
MILRVKINGNSIDLTYNGDTVQLVSQEEKKHIYRQPIKDKNWTPNKLRNSKVRKVKEVI